MVECSDRESELEGFIAALQAKKREMREELKRFVESRNIQAGQTSADGSGPSTEHKVNRAIDEATSAFDRVLENNAGVPGLGPTDARNAANLPSLRNFPGRIA